VAKTCTDLLAAVRRAAFLPDASDQSSSDLLAFADQELETLISEAVVLGRGEHWYATEDTTIAAGTTSYRLPRRLLGRAVRGVTVVPPSRPEYPLAQVDPIELRSLFSSGAVSNPGYFAFEGDFVKLGAVPAEAGWTLRVHYIMRPSKLVEVSATENAQVYAAVSTTNVRIIETAPSTNLTTALGLVDIVRGSEPYDVIFLDRKVSVSQAFSAPNFYFESSTPIVVADIASLASPLTPGQEPARLMQRDQTCLPPIPAALWTSLVYATAAAALAAVRDPGASQMAARAMAAKSQAMNLMEPRDERQTQTIVNPHSGLRSRGVRRWR
jgi:hypothetical protein